MICRGGVAAAAPPRAKAAATSPVTTRRSVLDPGLDAGIESASGPQEPARVLIVLVEKVGDAAIDGEYVVYVVIDSHVGCGEPGPPLVLDEPFAIRIGRGADVEDIRIKRQRRCCLPLRVNRSLVLGTPLQLQMGGFVVCFGIGV